MEAKRKQSSSVAPSKTRRTGIDPKWHEDFPWILHTDDRDGMLCSVCRKHARRPRKSIIGKAVWTDVPCRTITQQAMSTADCERGFAALSHIKTDLRNRLSSKMLNCLMTITCEGPQVNEFPYEKACDI